MLLLVQSYTLDKFSSAVDGERRRIKSSHVNYVPAKHQQVFYAIVWSCRKASGHQPSEVWFFLLLVR
jgi:hypothetical protein